jgi:RHS repeat-associated protein
MLAPTASAPNRPSPLPALPLSDGSLGPVVMADDPCEAAFSGADPTGPRKYYRARYYDPKIGRFISEDPIGFDGGMHFYSYVSHNPVNWSDPFGLETGNINLKVPGPGSTPMFPFKPMTCPEKCQSELSACYARNLSVLAGGFLCNRICKIGASSFRMICSVICTAGSASTSQSQALSCFAAYQTCIGGCASPSKTPSCN